MNDSVKYFEAVKYAYDLGVEEINQHGFSDAIGASSIRRALERWDIKEPVYDEKIDWKKVLYQIHLNLLIDEDISELSDMPGLAKREDHMRMKISEYVEKENLMDDFLARYYLRDHQEYRELIAEYGLKKGFWEV